MPSNKRESFVYTIMMCFVMVFWMSLYNIALQSGTITLEVLKTAWLGLPLGYCQWRNKNAVLWRFKNVVFRR